jgi:hypothetical protein
MTKQGYQIIRIFHLQKMKFRLYHNRSMSGLAAVFILVLPLVVVVMFSSASCEATAGQDAAVSLKDWMAARCGPPQRGTGGTARSIWLYQGELIDLQSGRPIAAVEGVEVVQALSMLSAHEERKASSRTQQVQLRRAYCQRLGDLQMAKTIRKMIKRTSRTATATTTDADAASLSLMINEQECTDDNDLSPFLSMGTLLSRKVFFYKPFPSSTSSMRSNSKNNNSKEKDDAQVVLRKIRLRPGSPERIIPLNQAVVCYETANTILETRAVSSLSSPDGEDHNEWIIHAEWPNGKTVWNRASVLRHGSSSTNVDSASVKKLRLPFWKKNGFGGGGRRRRQKSSSTLPKSRTLEFTVHHGQRPQAAAVMTATGSNDNDHDDGGDGQPVDETLLSALVMTQTKPSKQFKNDSGDDTTTTISPKRAAIVSFGPSTKGGGRGGGSIARETYQYRMDEDNGDDDVDSNASDTFSKASTKRLPSCTVRYTRYGEGPVWYGPNRMCALELRGRRIDNIPRLISSSSSSFLNDDNDDMVDSFPSTSSSSSTGSKSIISSPPLLAQLVDSLGFRNPSEDYYDVREDDYGRDAVQAFRQSKAARATQTLLGITNSNNGQEQDSLALLFGGGSPSNVRTSWIRRNRARLQGRIQTVAGRLREATTVELIRKRSNYDMMEE